MVNPNPYSGCEEKNTYIAVQLVGEKNSSAALSVTASQAVSAKQGTPLTPKAELPEDADESEDVVPAEAGQTRPMGGPGADAVDMSETVTVALNNAPAGAEEGMDVESTGEVLQDGGNL